MTEHFTREEAHEHMLEHANFVTQPTDPDVENEYVIRSRNVVALLDAAVNHKLKELEAQEPALVVEKPT